MTAHVYTEPLRFAMKVHIGSMEIAAANWDAIRNRSSAFETGTVLVSPGEPGTLIIVFNSRSITLRSDDWGLPDVRRCCLFLCALQSQIIHVDGEDYASCIPLHYNIGTSRRLFQSFTGLPIFSWTIFVR